MNYFKTIFCLDILSNRFQKCSDKHFGRKMSNVRPLFQALQAIMLSSLIPAIVGWSQNSKPIMDLTTC